MVMEFEPKQECPILLVDITDETSLAAAYMPFIRGGGLFVKTDRSIAMGTEIQVSLHLFEDPQDISIRGKVIWVNPAHGAEHGTSPNKAQGIGIGFPESLHQLQLRIENLLPDLSELPAETLTL
jgi:type IV pilus assembly protein PilZ